MDWRIHGVSREGVAMVSTPMSRERAISWARDLELIGDRIVKIEAENGEVVPEAELSQPHRGQNDHDRKGEDRDREGNHLPVHASKNRA